MKQQTWIAVILVGAVAVNGVAYMVVRSRAPAPASTPTAVAEAPRVASVVRTPPAEKVPEPEAPAEPAPAVEEDNPGLARAHRASGLAALEDRDYDKAVTEFTEALHLRKDKGDLVDLLRIAEDLRSRGQTKTARAEPTRTPSRTPAKPSRPGRAGSRTAARDEPATAEPETATRSGLLLVTSTPPGLVVQVDGRARDLTPARLTLTQGTYRVALLHGERLLVEERVEVKEDSVQSLNRDVSAELTPAPAPVTARAAPASEPTPAIKTPVATATPPAAPASTASTASTVGAEAAPRVASAASPRGDLDITSPALYGEVWINNRPYGFPPVSARGLPSGPARVEVRVNGEVKRRMTVEVQPGRSTPVRVR